eukprot:55738-Rhodomonas_salina.4
MERRYGCASTVLGPMIVSSPCAQRDLVPIEAKRAGGGDGLRGNEESSVDADPDWSDSLCAEEDVREEVGVGEWVKGWGVRRLGQCGVEGGDLRLRSYVGSGVVGVEKVVMLKSGLDPHWEGGGRVAALGPGLEKASALSGPKRVQNRGEWSVGVLA